MKRFLLLMLMGPGLLFAQTPSEQEKESSAKASDRFSLLIYTRTISDAKSNFRFDQNIVSNFRVNKWLRMELGLRQGERSNQIGAYNHYKVELQSKSLFKKRVRLIARMSDNIVRYGLPNYSRSNYIFIVETKNSLSAKWDVIANVGYVFTYQKNNVHQAEPTIGGVNENQSIYKFGIRYKLKDKGYLEGLFGSYDVFNPYQLQQPFYQISCDYELFEGGTLYSYLRYQYDHSFTTPMNDFLGLGIRFRLL